MSIKLQSTTNLGIHEFCNIESTGLLQRQCACGQHTTAGGECEECRQRREGRLQRAAVNIAPANGVPSIVHDVLNSPGRALDSGTRAFMEPRFGFDFSGVRVHTDARAAESAQAVNALAYTVGKDVVFGAGQYTPETHKGRRLMAHELTHVVQQRNSTLQGKASINQPGDIYEQEADQIADAVLGNKATGVQPTTIVTPLVQRACGKDLGSPKQDCAQSTEIVSGEIFYFVVNCDELQPHEREHFKNYAKGLPKGTILIIHGYASDEGEASFNMALSCHRANKITTMLGTARPDVKVTTPNLKHGATPGFLGFAFFRRSVIVEQFQPASCPGGKKDFWITVFFRRRPDRNTMKELRMEINGAKTILARCCLNLKFGFNWDQIPGSGVFPAGTARPAGDPHGFWDYPAQAETLGEGPTFSGVRGIPMLVVNDVPGSGGGVTVTTRFDKNYTGPDYFVIPVHQKTTPNLSDNHIAHELWHVGGGMEHDPAAGKLAEGAGNQVSDTYCNKVRSLVP